MLLLTCSPRCSARCTPSVSASPSTNAVTATAPAELAAPTVLRAAASPTAAPTVAPIPAKFFKQAGLLSGSSMPLKLIVSLYSSLLTSTYSSVVATRLSLGLAGTSWLHIVNPQRWAQVAQEDVGQQRDGHAVVGVAAVVVKLSLW
eukprot:9096-Heterococcus_DN1.PRE.1